jgi:predicted transcriptional regulator
VKAIAEDVGINADTIRYHLRILKDRDLVEHLNIGNSSLYRPSSVLEDWASLAFERGLKDPLSDLVASES